MTDLTDKIAALPGMPSHDMTRYKEGSTAHALAARNALLCEALNDLIDALMWIEEGSERVGRASAVLAACEVK